MISSLIRYDFDYHTTNVNILRKISFLISMSLLVLLLIFLDDLPSTFLSLLLLLLLIFSMELIKKNDQFYIFKQSFKKRFGILFVIISLFIESSIQIVISVLVYFEYDESSNMFMDQF